MAKITIISVGKIKKGYIKKGIEDYSEKIKKYASLEILDFDAGVLNAEKDEKLVQSVLDKEAVNIENRIKEGSIVIALDVKGKAMSSEKFASTLNQYFVMGKSHITFIIGGSYGLHNRILERADIRLSMSEFTFPHQLARLIILEQIFRAFKILKGETYHK